ncbi:cation-independent mannose-6-phosphate receptor-like [Ostrea edulis]|uniref:cation-independent mannose-6-phosphate receptor-like n=1 Tax=Ostrea edulis TaxID=37623 RepID=UPI0024AF6630|nr:cation-independent mannose-6-phosphate receptor-like [Ostrea edulis]
MKYKCLYFMEYYLVFLIFLRLSLLYTCAEQCIINNIDFSAVERFGPWECKSDDGNITYKINLCDRIVTGSGDEQHNCHSGTVICMIKDGGAFSIANYTKNTLDAPSNKELAETWIVRSGDSCPDMSGENLNSVINLKCGKSLGVPRFLSYTYCTSYFEWRTSYACQNMPVSHHEVPCYVYDDHGRLHDLSALVKTQGGYLVDSAEGWDFYINVCRDISSGTGDRLSRCPSGSAACRISSKTVIDMGHTAKKLQIDAKGHLMLTYLSNVTVPECTTKPTTTIQFVCPEAGGSEDPVLEFDFNCQYRVLWKTEHACPEVAVTSSSCRLNDPQRNIDLDLTPLTNSPGVDKPYEVFVNASGSRSHPLKYFINVCGELGIQCPDEDHVKGVAVCQTMVGNSSWGHVSGTTDHQQLKFVDGLLTLTYRGGEKCNHNNFQRETIISFHCNHSAVYNGKGWPVFNREKDCTYLFDWDTKYACLDHPIIEECRVNHNGKRYDLSPLVKHSGMNWNVLEGGGGDQLSLYYINVCSDILHIDQAVQCKSDSSVCLIDNFGVHSLGRYVQNPTFDPRSNTIQITYTEGDLCKDNTKKKSSIITFICKPGDMDSGPVLLRRSLDECIYEFEWQTAAACVLSRETGSECKVYNPDLGINFDLNKLRASLGHYYNVTSGDYDYILNLCGPVKNTICDKNAAHVSNPGICQVKHGGTASDAFVTGQSNSNLTYYDGLLKLKYENGALYNSKPPAPRQTEITLICDRQAGRGSPQFLDEGVTAARTYTFYWNTEFACPSSPIECTATGGGKQYDLSSLSRGSAQDNWAIVDDSNPNSRTKFYINVCGPLKEVNVGTGCSPFAAICQTHYQSGQEQLLFDNLGEVTSAPTVEGMGQLSMKYVSIKNECQDINNQKNNWTTTIHFVCKKGALISGPNLPQKIGNCEYSFVWETEAACPIADTETKNVNCTIKDRNSDYTFNMSPLKRSGNEDYYEMNAMGTDKIRLNLCGSINSSHCSKVEGAESAACLVKNTGSTQGLATVSHVLDYSEDGRLMMTFDGVRLENGQRTQVIILFLCRQSIPLGAPEFVRKEENAYYFNFKTSLACRPQPVDCLVQDEKGNQYDLSPLARTGTNWQVLDTREDYSDLTYYINVCRPINAIRGSTCPGGPVGGCQMSSLGRAYNMGYIQSQPLVTGNGTLTLRYAGGDQCHKGQPTESSRSTRINFFCSPSEHSPTFEGETDTCEYIFNWQTPAACPIQRIVGQNCTVSDPVYGFTFDLNSLRNTSSNYKVSAGDYMYELNVCGPLLQSSLCSDSTIASCQTKPADSSFHFDAGHSSSKLVYDAGEITLTYDFGHLCHNKYNRSTVITFMCDQSKSGQEGPSFLNETEDCTYQFVWPTSMACTPFKIGDCSVRGTNGDQFDLSSLSLNDDNYQTIDHLTKKKYIFNVCRSLIHQKGETCPFNSAACIVDLSVADPKKGKKFHNIGEVNEQQVLFLDGHVQLLYKNGEVCSEDPTKHTSTRILLYCSKDSIDTSPTGHFLVGCEHRFVWQTAAACPLESPSIGAGNCTVANPRSGYTFDLQSLKQSQGYKVDDRVDHIFTLNVCAPVTGTPCNAKSGTCQVETKGEKRSFNAGNVNANLQYNDGILFLNYTGGDKCHNNQFERNTIISFICSSGTGHGQPEFIAETGDCTYQFVWHTELACEEQVRCSVEKDDYTIDLSPLIKRSGHHLAVSTFGQGATTNGTFYINICRPLNPIYGKLCPPGASICWDRVGKPPVSLGKARTRPQLDRVTKKIYLLYDHGTKCPTNNSMNMTTKIVFNCKPGPSIGVPVLEYVHGCQYIFEWDTNVVCERNKTEVSKGNCVYIDPITRVTYNFTGLKTQQPVQLTRNGLKYLINLCEGLGAKYPGCENSSLCRWNGTTGHGYGSISSEQFISSEEQLKMVYRNGKECKGSSEGVINFECELYTYPGSPSIMFTSECQGIFRWGTRTVCPSIADQCTLAHNGHVYDLRVLSRQQGSWNLTDIQGNMYWINICQGVHNGPDQGKCSDKSASCRRTPDGKVDSLGMVTSQSLIMEGDGKTLRLEYTSNDLACTSKHRRSDNLKSRTVIRFECGNSVGGPVYIPRQTSNPECVFEFKWKSAVACRVERHSVKENKGEIMDPRSGALVDITKFYGLHTISGDSTDYQIDLSGTGTSCPDHAAICRLDKSQVIKTTLGVMEGQQFYIEDDILEVVLTTNQNCDKDAQKKITSIVQFHCNHDGLSNPQFLFDSMDCTYIFIWENPYTCAHPVVVNPKPIGNDEATPATTSPAVKSKTVATIVAVFLSAIVMCLLLIVFHKKERREAVASRLRGLIRRHSAVYRYSEIPSSEEVDDLLPEISANNLGLQGSVQTSTNDEVNILQNEELPAVSVFHDDSDEELLA